MARRYRRKRLVSEMNVVPYIDVMLVLLIIFMVTAPLITQGVKVDLPQVASQAVQSDKEPLVVSVDREGNFYVDYGDDQEKPVDEETLVTRVRALLKHQPGIQVLVNGHKDVSYARVVRLMAVLQEAGVPSVGLMTEPPASR
jgi:biopolymer transport protein TolR